MKKILLFLIAIAGYNLIPAQEIIKGGDWKVNPTGQL